MADTKNAAPTEEYNDNGTKNPDYVAPKIEGEGATDTTKTAKDGKEIVEKKEGEDEEDAFDDTIDPEKPPEIPVRKSTAQHIIARQGKKIAKLRSKLKEGDEGYVAPTDEGEDGEDDNLSEDARNAITKETQKVIAPLLGKLASEADEKELQELISSNPDAKKYVNHIKAYMAHDAWKNVPVTAIYHHLAFSSAEAKGAKKKKAADLEADQGKSGGRTIVEAPKVGNLPSAEEINNMSEDEFAKMEEEVLQGKFIQK